jgi:hypothetical protein
MSDLETLIRRRQDELRGRPRDWIDDARDWWRAVDWEFVTLIVFAAALNAIVFGALWLSQ